jgi:translation initiation factor IF-3
VSTSTNTLSDPVSLWSTLRSFDHKTHRLIQVVPDEPDNPHFVPTCKIVSKKEMYDFEKRRKAAMKDAKKVAKLSGEAAMKTLELNWAIDVGNDLNHRMDRLREFLGEGRRVEIVLAAKKRGRKATTEECENVLRVIRETVDSVEGAKEREAFTGKLGGMMTGTFQGKPVKAGGHVEEPARDGEEE